MGQHRQVVLWAHTSLSCHGPSPLPMDILWNFVPWMVWVYCWFLLNSVNARPACCTSSPIPILYLPWHPMPLCSCSVVRHCWWSPVYWHRDVMEDDSSQVTSIIHIDSIVWGAHLIPVYGELFLPCDFSHFDSLTAFRAYYVNKFIDYHANEIAFWNVKRFCVLHVLLPILGFQLKSYRIDRCLMCLTPLRTLDFNQSLIVNSSQTIRGLLRLI